MTRAPHHRPPKLSPMRLSYCPRPLVVAAALACAVGLAPHAHAQSSPCTLTGSSTACYVTIGTAAMNVPAFASLSLSTGPVAALASAGTFGGASVLNVGSATLTVQANTGWAVVVAAGSPTFTRGGVASSKAASDLLYGVGAYGSTPMTTAGQAFKSGTATSGATAAAYFSVKLSFANDSPATYAIPVTFTLTAP